MGALFTRNLAKRGKDVVFEDRDLTPVNGVATEVFSNPREDRALVKTLRGKKVFDQVNLERIATHELRLVWREDITAEQWVRLGARRLRILTAENCCEDDGVLVLVCTERGDGGKLANSA